MNQNTKLDDAARNHQAYVRMNSSGGDTHHEIAGKPGFTGTDPKDREVYAGYAATVASEAIAFGSMSNNTTGESINVLINSLYHRSAMMSQGFTGVGVAPEGDFDPAYYDMGAIKTQRNAGDYVVIYPIDKQTGVRLTHGLEVPNPFYPEMDATQENMCAKTSSPVSVATEASTTLTVKSFTISEAGETTPLDARLLTKSASAQNNSYLSANVSFLIGKAPFKESTNYTVHFFGKATDSAIGTTNGIAIEKIWTFTTGSFKRGCA